ncbi:coiled-coil domain-containing protein 87 [Ambystoma mexicanum]|uniref:coiled-coil domain-containing protein 87 n=1 Tax=Ambystoma mexicanum TaxID=8296 RepID=UPI0037E8F318
MALNRTFALPSELDSGGIAQLYRELLLPLTLLPKPRREADKTSSGGPSSRQTSKSEAELDYIHLPVSGAIPGASRTCRPAPAAPVAPLRSDGADLQLPPPLTPEAAGSVPPFALPRLLEARLRRLPCPGLPDAVPTLLRELVLGEVRALCREPRLWVPETSLKKEEQMEMQRRLVAHIALASEGLLQHYLQLLQEAGPGVLLTPAATLTRLRAQFLQHCTLLLNPNSIRVSLLWDMRRLRGRGGLAWKEGTEQTEKGPGMNSSHSSQPRIHCDMQPEEAPKISIQRDTQHASSLGGRHRGGAPGTSIRETRDAQPLGTSARSSRGARGASSRDAKATGGVPGINTEGALATSNTDPEVKQSGDAFVCNTEGVLSAHQHEAPAVATDRTLIPKRKCGSVSGEDPNTHLKWASVHQPTKYTKQTHFGKLSVPDQEIGNSLPEPHHLTCKTFTDCTSTLSMDYFIKLSRPLIERPRQQTVEDLKEIENIMLLDLSKVYRLLHSPQEGMDSFRNMPCQAVGTPCPGLATKDAESPPQTKRPCMRNLKRCKSLPNLRMGQLLSDELGICIKGYLSVTSLISLNGVTPALEEPAAKDLQKLLQASNQLTSIKGEDLDADADLPPLIRALNRGTPNTSKLMNIHKRLNVLSQKEELQLCENNFLCKEPACPQTDTVSVHVSNKPSLKTADVRVSSRIFQDVGDIKKYPPIYNDLMGELDPATISRLDGTLFKGEDVREVYAELKKSFPTEHLQLDQDPSIELCATNVDLSKVMDSSTLTRRRSERVINAHLRNLSQPEKLVTPPPRDQKRSPANSSWLKQTPETINMDDYLKYVSLQDTDYLGVVFHLYNSDESEDEDNVAIKAAKYQKEQRLGTDNVKNLELQSQTAADEMLQSRLEAIWTRLHVPEGERLDMAIKYSSPENIGLILQAVSAWEKVSQVIHRREQLLAKLELFEQTASDPNRFFQRCYEGSFLARKNEARERKALHVQIAKTETDILKMLKKIKKTYNDTVTFKGRPYLEKMQWDKTEMLYWLQQERRKTLMESDLKCVMLPPLRAPL